jgi:predicted transcriptional regulator
MSSNYIPIRQDILAALAGDEEGNAARVYARLACAPMELWQAEAVLRLRAETDGRRRTAWAQLMEQVGRPEQEIREALAWLVRAGIIRYEAEDEEREIRVEFVELCQLNVCE